jgi:hypothetical protein
LDSEFQNGGLNNNIHPSRLRKRILCFRCIYLPSHKQVGPTIALATLGMAVAAHAIALAAHGMPWQPMACLGLAVAAHTIALAAHGIALPWGIPMYIMEPTFTTNDYN